MRQPVRSSRNQSLLKFLSLSLAAAFSAATACSQAMPPARDVYMHSDGHCAEAHPGDTVHYGLTIQGLENAPAVYADLQMHAGRQFPFQRGGGLPAPDLRSMGGGGMAKSDLAGQSMYEYSFVVPKEIYGGVYRGVSVTVSTNVQTISSAQAGFIDVSRRTQKQVHAFCLTVVAPGTSPSARPEVTGFQAGQVVPR